MRLEPNPETNRPIFQIDDAVDVLVCEQLKAADWMPAITLIGLPASIAIIAVPRNVGEIRLAARK